MSVRDWVTATLILALLGGGLYVLVPAYARYRDTRLTIDELEQSVRLQENELSELKRELAALRTDYRAIERVARERFGLCREGEEIYHFEVPPAGAGDAAAGDAPTPRSAAATLRRTP